MKKMRLIRFGSIIVATLFIQACTETEVRPTAICPAPGPGALLFWAEPESVMRGQTLPLTPSVSSHPGSYDPLPSSCLKDISVTPEGAADIETDADGDFVLVIAQDAPLGETLRVRANYRTHTISGRMTVFDRNQSPLVGYWRQTEGSCPEETIIRELVFSADGTFSVTWEPFETYKDYWGEYQYDPESGELTLTVERGNNFRDVKSGTVRLEEGTLNLGTASFGARYDDLPECRASFE